MVEEKLPKNFAEFYQEMKALMDEFKKKTGEDMQKFYLDIDARIKKLEGGTDKRISESSFLPPCQSEKLLTFIVGFPLSPEQNINMRNEISLLLKKYGLKALMAIIDIDNK